MSRITAYYVSQDVRSNADGTNFQVLDTWSVYSEEYHPDDWYAGEPIDGSQRHVSTHDSQSAAQNEARRLWDESKPLTL